MVNGDSYLPVLKPVEAVKRARAGEFPNRDHYRGFIPGIKESYKQSNGC